MKIKHFDTETDIKLCFPLMKTLRPKLISEETFVEQVMRQQKESYRILGLEDQGKLVALAGYRELQNLIHGSSIYIDDLVTDPQHQGLKYGEKLLTFIFNLGRERKMDQVVLDTGLANTRAQEFYRRVGMTEIAKHFYYDIKEKNL